MTTYVILQTIGAYLIMCPFYLTLGARSLEFYVTHSNASKEAIKSFLDGLKSPLRGFYADPSNYNFLSRKAFSSPLEHLETLKMKEGKYTLNRLLAALPPILMILAITVGLLRRGEIFTTSINYFLLLVVNCVSLFLAWRFGKKLQSIEETLRSN